MKPSSNLAHSPSAPFSSMEMPVIACVSLEWNRPSPWSLPDPRVKILGLISSAIPPVTLAHYEPSLAPLLHEEMHGADRFPVLDGVVYEIMEYFADEGVGEEFDVRMDVFHHLHQVVDDVLGRVVDELPGVLPQGRVHPDVLVHSGEINHRHDVLGHGHGLVYVDVAFVVGLVLIHQGQEPVELHQFVSDVVSGDTGQDVRFAIDLLQGFSDQPAFGDVNVVAAVPLQRSVLVDERNACGGHPDDPPVLPPCVIREIDELTLALEHLKGTNLEVLALRFKGEVVEMDPADEFV